MLAVIEDGGVERYDDLHIDQIDSRWVDRKFWVSGALQAIQIAQNLRDRHFVRHTLSVAFSLRDGRKALGVNFRTLDAFEKRLDWMPPSLYLFKKGTEPWNLLAAKPTSDPAPCISTQVDSSELFGLDLSLKGCFYIEFARKNSKGYGRSLFLVS